MRLPFELRHETGMFVVKPLRRVTRQRQLVPRGQKRLRARCRRGSVNGQGQLAAGMVIGILLVVVVVVVGR